MPSATCSSSRTLSPTNRRGSRCRVRIRPVSSSFSATGGRATTRSSSTLTSASPPRRACRSCPSAPHSSRRRMTRSRSVSCRTARCSSYRARSAFSLRRSVTSCMRVSTTATSRARFSASALHRRRGRLLRTRRLRRSSRRGSRRPRQARCVGARIRRARVHLAGLRRAARAAGRPGGELNRPSLLVVVQRYGDVPGGAEAHARTVVQRLASHFAIEVATTNSTDYLTWRGDLTAGLDRVDGVTVRRFPVERPRAWNFKLYERRAFRSRHTLDDERAFIDAQGPYAPELLDFLFKCGRDYDHVLFFTYIYYPTVLGLPLVPERAVLVPTAHEESAIGLAAYKPVFHAPRAIAYNTEEERRMVWRRFRNERVSNEIVGVGIDVPAERNATRFREKHGITGPYPLD